MKNRIRPEIAVCLRDDGTYYFYSRSYKEDFSRVFNYTLDNTFASIENLKEFCKIHHDAHPELVEMAEYLVMKLYETTNPGYHNSIKVKYDRETNEFKLEFHEPYLYSKTDLDNVGELVKNTVLDYLGKNP